MSNKRAKEKNYCTQIDLLKIKKEKKFWGLKEVNNIFQDIQETKT